MHRSLSEQLFEQHTSGLSDLLLQERGWRIVERAYPVLDVQFDAKDRVNLRVRMTCDNWNELPPSIELFAADGTQANPFPRDPAGVFNPNPHPITGKPFICSVGSRQYHTHSSHTNDHWENYRNHSSFDLGGILTRIWRAWQEATT